METRGVSSLTEENTHRINDLKENKFELGGKKPRRRENI